MGLSLNFLAESVGGFLGREEMDGDRVDAGTSASSGICRDPIPAGDNVEVLSKDWAAEVDDEDEDNERVVYVPGPLIPLKEQIEKDKDDESLRRWKQKLLGCLEDDLINDKMEPEVTFLSIGIVTEDSAEINTRLPVRDNQNPLLFILKEGSQYHLKLTFTVKHNIVSGLRYINTVWKGGLQVDHSRGMLGTFAPQREQYIHIMDEETTPTGVFARGIYSAKLKFEDDDKRCHLELDYSFEIKKRLGA
ncbi:rho GDP-dissociation inhibitor 1-like [Aristolochia californica]|uniref:rho GDP-dissociation inhibitor 1-like n=1 Tax=Aristolochia californica TaxID=171875 RepID=UPI0035D5A60A